MTTNKTYKHKLTNETLTVVKNASKPCPVFKGEINLGVIFKNNKGEERFLTNRQIQKLLK